MHLRPAATLALGLMSPLLPAPALAEDVTVFAAASLKDALDAFSTAWQAETGHTVTISYAGSSALAAQIIAGAPADIFISAAVDWTDEVDAQGLVQTRKDILGNTLVLIAHGQDAAPVALADLPALLGDGRLSMAMVDAVPAGQYGRAALETLGLWDRLEPFVAQSENVRAALAFVAAGEAPFGIVYATDAAVDDNVTVVATFPARQPSPDPLPRRAPHERRRPG